MAILPKSVSRLSSDMRKTNESTSMSYEEIEDIGRQYFSHWNNRCLDELHNMLHPNCRLVDWITSVSGASGVLEANKAIFADHPDAKIDVLNIAVAPSHVLFAEIIIELDKNIVVPVVDILKIRNSKIFEILAFKR